MNDRTDRRRTPPKPYAKLFVSTVRAVLSVVCLASAAEAQPADEKEDVDSPGLTIEAVAGWEGEVDQSTPTPVSFLFRNDSELIIEGILTLSDSSSGEERSLGEVVLGPRSIRRFTTIQAMTDWSECVAEFRSDGAILWRRTLPLITGSYFYSETNVVLFIDDSGRSLRLPGPNDPATTPDASESAPALDPENQSRVVRPVRAGKPGRAVEVLTVKTWQVPNHPGPLFTAKAIVFPENASERDMNQVQWEAVAEWMCRGGVVFVHGESREVVDRLLESSPLSADPAVAVEPFLVHRSGLGGIYEYSQPLFAGGGNESRRALAAAAANLTDRPVAASTSWWWLSERPERRIERNGLLIGGFFSLYMILTGVVSLFLFRLGRRRIGAYTVVVVVGASVVSGLIGGYVRNSRGDLRWVSLTEGGAGGFVQTAGVEVQSAGGSRTHAAIRGERSDLQQLESAGGFAPWHPLSTHIESFTWQPDLSPDDGGAYEIAGVMPPWGRRRLHASAFGRGYGPMDFQLKFEAGDSQQNAEDGPFEVLDDPPPPVGRFSVNLVNNLPFDLTECHLVVGVALAFSEPVDPSETGESETAQFPPGWVPSTSQGSESSISYYHVQALPDLPAGASRNDTSESRFNDVFGTGQYPVYYGGWGPIYGSNPPAILREGLLQSLEIPPSGASAWIVGRIAESPFMEIDEERSDFVPYSELHIYVQEILPEEMPDASLFARDLRQPLQPPSEPP